MITIRRSHDGATWTPEWNDWTLGPGFPKELMLTPNEKDPEDLEFYWFTPFPYEDRYAGIVTLLFPQCSSFCGGRQIMPGTCV